MAEPLLQAGADLFGESQFPSQRSLFTPSAFGRAIDIRQRASLARQSAAGALGMLDAMTKIGEFEQQTRDLSEDTDALRQQARIFRQRQQDEAIRKYEEEAKERELQPQYREMIQSIDPYDPAAPEQYAALYPRIGQVDARTQSDIAIRMAAAQKFRQDQDTFLRAARGAGFSEQDITERLDALRKEARVNPDAFVAAATSLPTYNQTEAEAAQARAYERSREEAASELAKAGLDPTKPISKNLESVKSYVTELQKSQYPGLNVEKFLDDPDLEIQRIIAAEKKAQEAPVASSSKNWFGSKSKTLREFKDPEEIQKELEPAAKKLIAIRMASRTPSKKAIEAARKFSGETPSEAKTGVAPASSGGTVTSDLLRKYAEQGAAQKQK